MGNPNQVARFLKKPQLYAVNVVQKLGMSLLVAWGLGLDEADAQAQVQDVRWNMGGFVSYNIPMVSFGDGHWPP